ncbi:MAG: NAD-dependent epimerase/dehydratase family protein [Candidatus Aminicenantes bacterium]|nr:MAG: NAD-dependent epimerase/dehydratase family protein [Candidatus Aminicenantes bacterium]
MRRILLTGSSGLIGSELVSFFAQRGWEVCGIDNNMRADFFGFQGDTRWAHERLIQQYPTYFHHDCDVRDRKRILELVKNVKPTAVIHASAQPSHDLAAQRPFDDFDVNAGGTLNLLEANRQTNLDIPFVFLSTNKVYGDGPNHIPLVELDTRWDYRDKKDFQGICENFPVDHSLHSVFGASKLAADIMVQEYGRYFGMPTCCLRCGCVTGPNQSAVELHGFLSYLIKCNVENSAYKVFGYKGKQVRDNIHSYDVAQFIYEFIQKPGIAAVYNLGGGRGNSVSILEAISLIESISSKKLFFEYLDQNRKGDHICYISDLSKIQKDFPNWAITKNLPSIFEEIYQSWKKRLENT